MAKQPQYSVTTAVLQAGETDPNWPDWLEKTGNTVKAIGDKEFVGYVDSPISGVAVRYTGDVGVYRELGGWIPTGGFQEIEDVTAVPAGTTFLLDFNDSPA